MPGSELNPAFTGDATCIIGKTLHRELTINRGGSSVDLTGWSLRANIRIQATNGPDGTLVASTEAGQQSAVVVPIDLTSPNPTGGRVDYDIDAMDTITIGQQLANEGGVLTTYTEIEAYQGAGASEVVDYLGDGQMAWRRETTVTE
jgi:hypothetical protein